MDPLRSNTNPAPVWRETTADSLSRTSVVIEGSAPLFGWYHSGGGARLKDCAAVICNPFGYEYTHAHRSLRHLADRLAQGGVPTLRFDYYGTGDSPGDDTSADDGAGLLACWLADIRAAVARVKALSGRNRVCLIGVRLGATLAALASAELDIDYLVTWAPCVSGRRYVRELRALALAAEDGAGSDTLLESAGFRLSARTAAQLQGIDLLKQHCAARKRILVVERDDRSEDPAFPDALKQGGQAVDVMKLPGYDGMFAEPHFTEVPAIAIEAITQWLTTQLPSAIAVTQPPTPAQAIRFDWIEDGAAVPLSERGCRFGAHGRLFGILSQGPDADTDKPAVVLLNSGSVHHVGPNRLYVLLSRALSARGYTCLRMDTEGLGDSVGTGPRENHPYQDSALADTDAALHYLRTHFHCRRFILLGLCSGAHTAFHAGLQLQQYQLDDLILLNPLTFHWTEDSSLDTTQHFQDVAYYRGSVRTARSWLKLLRGQVNLLHIAKVALSQCSVLARARCDALVEIVLRRPTTQLGVDLRRLFALKRTLSLFIASKDPGYDILLANAKRMAAKGLREGNIHLQFIEGADHTFSRHARRRDLIDHLLRHIDSVSQRG